MTDFIQKPNARGNVILTEEGRVVVVDRDDPEGIDLLETIRDLIRRVEDLEHGK